MNRFRKPIQAFFVLALFITLTGCTLGQAAEPTPTEVDVNAVMTSAAATAFFQLTEIAGVSTATLAPTATQSVQESPTLAETSAEAATPTTGEATPTAPALVIGSTDTPVVPGLPTAIPSFTPIPVIGGVATAPAQVCKNSVFVADVTIPDGTVMKPGQKFTKIWSVQNTGFCAWDEGFGIVFWAGDSMSGQNDFFSPGEIVKPDGVVDMAIEMRAPWTAGEYIGHWVMIDDIGQTFGTDLVVYIKVVP